MKEFIIAVSVNPIYQVTMWFIALFPIVVSALAVSGSRQFLLDRSRRETEFDFPHMQALKDAKRIWPMISIVIPARDEGAAIHKTIQAALELYWPEKEIIVIDDGSLDDTVKQSSGFGRHSPVRILNHSKPLGKSESLNQGIAQAKSELVLILDADARPAQNALDRMIPHFLVHPDIAAVTGNPRVANVSKLFGKLQAIEFSSTISTLRRAQAAYGRVNTISGIMTVLRKDLILEKGGFSSKHPTEDIELTWRLHRDGYRCIYEPAAQIAMEVPETLGQWWRQRTRWSSGLVRVLQSHGFPIIRKWEWPIFPILLEAIAAIIWCHLWIIATVFWIVSAISGLPTLGNSLIIGHWGTMAVGFALVQILYGMKLDANHDRNIWKLFVVAPIYPIFYWSLSALVVVATTIPTLLTKPVVSTWSLARKERTL